MKLVSKLIITFLILIITFTNISFAYYPDTAFVWSESVIPTNADGSNAEDFLNLTAESAILIEQTTGKVLYQKNPHEKLRPASVTKIMTILLIMEAIDSGQINYDTQISCSENAASMGGSQIWLEVRRKLKCR